MARTRPHLVIAVLGLSMLAAVGCVQRNNPQGWAGPVTNADGTVLVASTAKGKLSAIKTDDFSRLWTFPSGDEKPEIKLEAIYGTPLVDGSTVYFGAYSGDVYALGLDDGKVRWRFDADGPVIAALGAIRGRAPPPAPGPVETVLLATEKGTVYALDAADGSVQWRFDAGDDVWGAPLWTGTIYVASVNGKLFALNAATGEPKWDQPFSTGHGLISDPIVAEGTLLVGGIDRTLHAVDAETGEERWAFKTDNWFWGRPLVDETSGTVYAPNLDGRLYALDTETGEQRWLFEAEEPDPLRSAPVLAGGVLVIVDRSGNVYGLDPEAGTLKWSAPAALEKTVLSNPLVVGEEVLISAQGGDLFRVDASDGSFVEVETP